MAIEVTDGMIRRLTQEWVATLPAQYPEPKHPHRFSLRFHWKMRPILRQARKQETGPVLYHGLRFATAVLVAALMTFTIAMAVPAIRERVFQMVREIHERYSHIYYEQIEGDQDFEDLVPYHLTSIPEGFTLMEDWTSEVFHNEIYVNEEGLIVALDQSRYDMSSFDIDTEKVEPVEILLNGDQPAWYLGNPSLKVIYWDDGTYVFHVSSHLSREELIKIAETISMN